MAINFAPSKSVSESSRQTLLGRRYYSTLLGQFLCPAHVQRAANIRQHALPPTWHDPPTPSWWYDDWKVHTHCVASWMEVRVGPSTRPRLAKPSMASVYVRHPQCTASLGAPTEPRGLERCDAASKDDAITPHFGDPGSPPSYHVRTLAAHVELAAAPAF
ncbi:hypothetical protein BM1_01266 [Bipolaris maydis]|nr:hypothetical protein BM1_01266 [Bipolaris maydis]